MTHQTQLVLEAYFDAIYATEERRQAVLADNIEELDRLQYPPQIVYVLYTDDAEDGHEYCSIEDARSALQVIEDAGGSGDIVISLDVDSREIADNVCIDFEPVYIGRKGILHTHRGNLLN